MQATLIGAAYPTLMPMTAAPSAGTPGANTTSAPATGSAIETQTVYQTYQLISAAAATVIVEGTNELLSATGTNNNWCLIATLTLASAGTVAANGVGNMFRWIRARTTAATTPTQVYAAG